MKSPSERFVRSVIAFMAGTHMHGKPRPSTYSLMHEGLTLRRQVKEFDRLCAERLKRK